MKLVRVGFKNFKAYAATPEGDEFEIDLNGKSTVFYGLNGVGKSTILAAICYALWPFLNKIVSTQGTEFRTMSEDLVHIGLNNKREKLCEVLLEFFDGHEGLDGVYYLTKGIQLNNNKTVIPLKAGANDVQQFVTYFTQEYLSDIEGDGEFVEERINMPVFLSYGTNRTVIKVPLRVRKKHSFDKRSALERALESRLDFGTFFEWYRNQEDYEYERKVELKDFSYKDRQLECVRSVICEMLEDITEIKVKRSPVRMVAVKNGVEYRIEQLSDGEKCTLALLGDLARRIAIANPMRENPLEGEGVVMIDEIDLHMHPSWQRKILGLLKKKFPNIQFLITTHSPQVIGEVDSSYNLYRLTMGDNNQPVVEITNSFGLDSSTILRTDMDTKERNAGIIKLFDQFDSLLDEEDYEKAGAVLEQLKENVAEEDEEIVKREVQLRLEQV